MASRYKITLGFGQFFMGASETYYTGEIEVVDLVDQLNEYLAIRKRMLWEVHEFVGVRVARVGDRRVSVFLPPGDQQIPGGNKAIVVPATGFNAGTGVQSRPDQFRAAGQIRLFLADGRSFTRYLAGLPDVMTGTEPKTFSFDLDSNWYKAYLSMGQFLKANGWSIRARVLAPTRPEYEASDLVIQSAAPSLLGVVIPGTPTPVIGPNDKKVTLRGFRPKRGITRSINGGWYVNSVNSTLVPGKVVVFLRGTAGINPDDYKVMGRLQVVAYNYFPITNWFLVRVGIHKRGRPFSQPVGRRTTRVLLDP